jgi:hypothetical protein
MRTHALVLTGAMLAVAVSGCDTSSVCAVTDASGSALYAQAEYRATLTAIVEHQAEVGGSVVHLVAKGQPQTEGDIDRASFSGLTGTERSGERENAIGEFLSEAKAEVARATAGDTSPSEGSGQVAALQLISGFDCDRIVLLTDALETTDFDAYSKDLLTAAGRAAMVDRLDRAGRLPDLDGIEVALPFALYVPQGTKLSRAGQVALELVWREIVERSGGTLRWRKD